MKMHECDSYPCYEYRKFGKWGNTTKAKLRKRHSSHDVVVTSTPFTSGTSLIGPGGNVFRSLIHKGKKR